MPKSDNKDSTRLMQEEKGGHDENQENPQSKQSSGKPDRLKELATEAQSVDFDSDNAFGWKLPGIEAYSVKYWALMFQVMDSTICEWIKTREIPYIGSDSKNSYILRDVWIDYMSKPKPTKPKKKEA